jgi:ABC-type glycerol-3-phosphate transport system substrate-binding protein
VKYFLCGVFALLTACYIIAKMTAPDKAIGNRTPLAWTTDPNPERIPQVAAFNKMFPSCQLSIDPDNSGVMKVVVQSSANMGPDIVGHVTPEMSYETYNDAGILLDVTEIAKERGFGVDSLPKDIADMVLLQVLTKDGRIEKRQFIYPCNVWHRYLIYNKNLFDKYDVPYPSDDLTWEEYLDICQRLTVYGENKEIPLTFGGMGVSVDELIWGKGGTFLNEDGTRCTLASKEVVDAMVFLHEMYHKLRVEPTPSVKAGVSSQGGWGGNISWLGQGKLGMLWGARWTLIQLRRFSVEQGQAKAEWIRTHPDAKEYQGPEVLRLGACLVPRFKGAKRYNTYGCRGAGVNKMGSNPDKAVNFLQYLASKEYSDLINRGADSKPGNKAYIGMEHFLNPEFKGEEEVHQVAIDAIPYSRVRRTSMFISRPIVERHFKKAKEKIISNASLTREDIASAMKDAANAIDLEIARNIKRNPRARKAYEILLKQGAQPITLDLENVQ